MFTVGPVHDRDHSPGRSIAGVWNRPLGLQEGLIGCPYQDGTKSYKSQIYHAGCQVIAWQEGDIMVYASTSNDIGK